MCIRIFIIIEQWDVWEKIVTMRFGIIIILVGIGAVQTNTHLNKNDFISKVNISIL